MKTEERTLRTNSKWDKAVHSIVLETDSGVALHRQLREALAQLIDESFAEGELFMTEDYLVDVFGISRGTVRRSLLDLAAGGVLSRKRGLGTVVRKAGKNVCRHISIIAPDYASPTNAEFLSALIEIGQGQGIDWNIVRLGLDQKMDLLERNVKFKPSDGAIILQGLPQRLANNLFRNYSTQGYLTVNVDTYIENYTGYHVGMSNLAAVKLGVSRLVEAGHRNIVFLVSEPEEWDTVRERARHFEEIAQEMGLAGAGVYHAGIHAGESDSEGAALSMPHIWEMNPRPTAIFAISDGCAMGALGWLQTNGIRVPDEISLLSFDGTNMTRLTQPNLSSIRQPYKEIAEAVFKIINENPTGLKRVFLDPDFVEGESIKRIL
jgi:LacI family transcriptional regulator